MRVYFLVWKVVSNISDISFLSSQISRSSTSLRAASTWLKGIAKCSIFPHMPIPQCTATRGREVGPCCQQWGPNSNQSPRSELVLTDRSSTSGISLDFTPVCTSVKLKILKALQTQPSKSMYFVSCNFTQYLNLETNFRSIGWFFFFFGKISIRSSLFVHPTWQFYISILWLSVSTALYFYDYQMLYLFYNLLL